MDVIRQLKNRVKKKLYAKLGIAFNPYGLSFTLGKRLEGKSKITLVDVGAYEGVFTETVDQVCGVTRGVLVEPQPAHAANLRSKFKPPCFEVVEALVCDESGTREMEVNVTDATSSILKPYRDLAEFGQFDVRAAGKITCRAATLDTIATEAKLEKIDLLKLDVQGAEHLVVLGGRKTLARTEMIWAETSFKRLYEGQCLHHELMEILAPSGFVLHEVEPGFRGVHGELLQTDSLFVRI